MATQDRLVPYKRSYEVDNTHIAYKKTLSGCVSIFQAYANVPSALTWKSTVASFQGESTWL